MTATIKKQEETKLLFVKTEIVLRLATSEDLRKDIVLLNGSGEPFIKKIPKYGQSYWVKSQSLNKFDNRNYQISEDTDWEEVKDFLRRDMLYVAASYFELKDFES